MLSVSLRLHVALENIAQRRVLHTLSLARWLGFLMFASPGGCSYLLDYEQPQCAVDEDCGKRGLTEAVCREQLCVSTSDAMTETAGSRLGRDEPAVSAASTGSDSSDASEGATRASSPAPGSTSGSTSVGVQPGAGGVAGSASSASAPGASGSPAAPSSQAAQEAESSTMSSMSSMSAGDGDPGACPGGVCPECTTEADCERMGMAGGVCSNGICFAPSAQCSADEACEMLGPEYKGGRCVASQCIPNPRWRCAPPPTAEPGSTKLVQVPVIDAVTRAPRVGAQVLACRILDLSCASPVDEITTGSDGMAVFNLEQEFASYLQTEITGYMPALYFIPDIVPAMDVYDDFPLLSTGVVANALAQSLGGELDSTRGHMMLIAEDCFFEPLGGVTISSPQQDEKTTLFYVQDMLPSTAEMQTTADGQGGFLNFPTGTASITLTQADTGLELTTVSLVVRAGFISVAFIPPRVR